MRVIKANQMVQLQGTQSLSRAFNVLKIVAQNTDGISLNRLIAKTGLNRTTAYRLAMALVAEGMLTQTDHNAHFTLGPECYMLGIAADKYFGVNRLAADAVARLAIKSGDAAFFSLRSDCFSVCVMREDGDHPLKTFSLQPGTRHPLGVGAAGLAILASLTDTEVEECLFANAETMRLRYPNIPAGMLRQEVAETRQKGYAFNKGKVTAGSWGIGVAIADPRKKIVGALSISAVVMRLQEDRQKELSMLLLKEKALLEDKLKIAETPKQ